VFNHHHVNRFNQNLYIITFFKTRIFQTVSRHHGRELGIFMPSPAHSHGDLRHNAVKLDVCYFTM
jgi:hypothetical protein